MGLTLHAMLWCRGATTDPEIAQVGMTLAQALAVYPDGVVSTWPIDRIDCAVCDNDRDGMIKIITTRSRAILGATIVDHRAGEAIMEVILTMQQRLSGEADSEN